MRFKDSKLSVYFETQEIMEDTLILLRFNCPDSECAYIGNGWGDLKLHVRATHWELMWFVIRLTRFSSYFSYSNQFNSDLCIRHKKVFSHEHALYPPSLLPIHLPSAARPNKATLKVPIEVVYTLFVDFVE